MSLGVLNNISAIYAENNLNSTQASLQNVLTQLSSGSRINSGADDAPASLSRMVWALTPPLLLKRQPTPPKASVCCRWLMARFRT